MIIGFHGEAGTGKDTAAMPLYSIGYRNAFFSEPIKAALNTMFGWTPARWHDRAWKDTPQPPTWLTPRQLAISLGTEWGREKISPGLWVDLTMQNIAPHEKVVFTDIRFENEAHAITDNGGIIIEVQRPDNPHPKVDHHSEDRLPAHLIDHTIINNGSTADLHAEVLEVLRSYSST